MKHQRQFEGGPADGGREDSPGPSYPTLTGKAHLGHGMQIVAIYEYDRTERDAAAITRIYRYRESLPRAEAAAALQGTQWHED
jgi:hypothetical protein